LEFQHIHHVSVTMRNVYRQELEKWDLFHLRVQVQNLFTSVLHI